MMLTGKLIHPQLMAALARCGHGDKILIADGNYPLAGRTKGAELIYLGLMPGLPGVADVLEAIVSAARVERAEVMDPFDGTTPAIFSTFEAMLEGIPLEKLERFKFYETSSLPDVRVAISTGETQVYANLLITVGVT